MAVLGSHQRPWRAVQPGCGRAGYSPRRHFRTGGGWAGRLGQLLFALALCAPLAGCASLLGAAGTVSTARADASGAAITAGLAAGVPRLRPVVLGRLPHDTGAWTEGLEVDGGRLYESTGLAGRSRVRELDPGSGRPLREMPLPGQLYGEGVTVLDGRAWQLTWRDGVALDWDVAALRPVRQLPWSGEGWGLCHTADGRVIASDGSDRLRVLSGTDLAPRGDLDVRIAGRPLPGLNELECVPGAVWANVYQTVWLVRIDLATGAVTAVVDGAGLLPGGRRPGPDGTDTPADGTVLNGIAALPGTDEFLLTGKLWPTLFRVRFDPAPPGH